MSPAVEIVSRKGCKESSSQSRLFSRYPRLPSEQRLPDDWEQAVTSGKSSDSSDLGCTEVDSSLAFCIEAHLLNFLVGIGGILHNVSNLGQAYGYLFFFFVCEVPFLGAERLELCKSLLSHN